ncbi:MAG: hypothetical protein FWD57_01415, partial [Polyangiaceae bacterium]|nr:hypothetical protein [Polyangiaceae bacterium]
MHTLLVQALPSSCWGHGVVGGLGDQLDASLITSQTSHWLAVFTVSCGTTVVPPMVQLARLYEI